MVPSNLDLLDADGRAASYARWRRFSSAVEKRRFIAAIQIIHGEQRRERLVLRGGRDAALRVQVREEGGDLLRAHLRRVSEAVEVDEFLDPEGVRLFGAAAVSAQARETAHAVEQLR